MFKNSISNPLKLYKYFYQIFSALLLISSCKSIHVIEHIPNDTYRISKVQYLKIDTAATAISKRNLLVNIEQSDSILILKPASETLEPFKINIGSIESLKLYRHTFDIDVLTVPFKIRPAANGFPEQLNANFDAALYLGRRLDSYTIKKTGNGRSINTTITGAGYGYGGFVGIGSVTMNPFVTNQNIDYEYDGFVLNGGIAGIYDAKKFNLGIAIGSDFLVDKNRKSWIYQGKPWIGVLFGINLN